MIDTLPQLLEYLDQRGATYGIPGQDLLAAIPESAREPSLAYEFMQMKDISHKTPLSHGGDPAGDNWLLEDSSINRSRGAKPMTQSEEALALADGHSDAKHLVKTASSGAALAGGMALAEGAMAIGAAAGTAAAGSIAVATEAAVVSTVVTVTVTTVLVGGITWLGWKLVKSIV